MLAALLGQGRRGHVPDTDIVLRRAKERSQRCFGFRSFEFCGKLRFRSFEFRVQDSEEMDLWCSSQSLGNSLDFGWILHQALRGRQLLDAGESNTQNPS